MSSTDVQIKQWLDEGKKDEAFRLLIKSTSRPLYGLVRRMVGDHMLADDMVQNIYLKVFEKIHSFRWESALMTWIYRIGVHEVLNIQKKEKIRRTKDLEGVEKADEVYLNYDEWEARFERVVEALPDQQKAVFILKYYEDRPYEEISKIMDRSVGALKANYHHAVKKIKASVTQNIEE